MSRLDERPAKVKKPFLPTRTPKNAQPDLGTEAAAPASQSARGKARTTKRSGTVPAKQRGVAMATVGNEPRVDLLPREVHAERRERALVRRAWLGVGLVALLAVLGVGAAAAGNVTTAADLVQAQSETQAILRQQSQYAPVRQTESSTALLEAGQTVGGSTEIDWSSYVTKIQATLPAGAAISSLSATSASPTATFAQASGPLSSARIATLTFTATTTTVPDVATWLDELRSLPGYADAYAGSVTLGSSTGSPTYQVNMTVDINDKAYDGKYAAKAGK